MLRRGILEPMATVDDEMLADWISAFEALPPDKRENVEKWFATQKIIIEASGLEPQAWFGYIEWALDNPFDYSFIQDFPDVGTGTEDEAERTDGTRSARQLVGGETRVAAPDADEGMAKKASAKKGLERELFDNFMKNRFIGK